MTHRLTKSSAIQKRHPVLRYQDRKLLSRKNYRRFLMAFKFEPITWYALNILYVSINVYHFEWIRLYFDSILINITNIFWNIQPTQSC